MSDDAVIASITANFVPAAVNLYKIREAKDAGGDVFRAAQKQKPNYQGFWIVSPQDGKLLAAHQQFKSHETWTSEVLATLAEALRVHGPVAPRKAARVDPLPHRGAGVQPDGNLCLAVHMCVLYGGKRLAPPTLDSILLTPADAAAFAPPAGGGEWIVADPVTRKFCRAISASADTSHMPEAEDLKVAELKASVEKMDGDLARIRLRGKWEAVKVAKYDAQKRPTYSASTADGAAVYNVRKNEMQSLLLVFDGTWRNVAPYDQPVHAAALVEWKR